MWKMSYDRLDEVYNELRDEIKQLRNDLYLRDILVDTCKAELKAKNERIKELEKNQFPSEPICEECGKPRKCLGIMWDKHYETCKRTT